MSVITALNGEQGLQRLKETSIELVISDQKMAGGMTGTEFLTQVKARSPEILTMILSAFSEPEYLMDAVNKAKTFQYILKPWNQDDLLHKVFQALQYYHAQAEVRRLAEANQRLLTKMALMENLALIGNFSTALYERFFPVLRASLCTDGQQINGGLDLNTIDKREWSHLGSIVSRLGQVGLFYHLPPGFQFANVAQIIQGCVAEAKQVTNTLDIEWQECYAPDLPGLLVQAEIFSCAIKALIENAVIFNDAPAQKNQRKVSINVYQTLDPEPMISIEIEDNGPGCSQSEKIFSPLFSTCDQQSALSLHNNDLGQYNFESHNHVGLGLFIARWCIAQHDGCISLMNSNTPGALFKIDIPINQEDLKQRLAF